MTISRNDVEIHIRCSGYAEALRVYAGIVLREVELEALTSNISRRVYLATLALLDETLKSIAENRIVHQPGIGCCAGDSIHIPPLALDERHRNPPDSRIQKPQLPTPSSSQTAAQNNP